MGGMPITIDNASFYFLSSRKPTGGMSFNVINIACPANNALFVTLSRRLYLVRYSASNTGRIIHKTI